MKREKKCRKWEKGQSGKQGKGRRSTKKRQEWREGRRKDFAVFLKRETNYSFNLKANEKGIKILLAKVTMLGLLTKLHHCSHERIL